ncbi:prefoldin subunit 2 [Anabrus simplex]|uniref:prefoldin subunit 2 n=1 Tax=Anabrus simplex TaxID=316456 RepID=UPI0034DD3D41
MASDGKKQKGKGKTNEEIFNGFQMLRAEQRQLASKLSELELEQHEHKLVIDTLKEVDGDRKCFRMIGGVLCERTVKDVLPVLITNKEQLGNVISTLSEQLSKKGVELNEYKEKYNIRLRGQDEAATEAEGEQKPRTGNVLVEQPM